MVLLNKELSHNGWVIQWRVLGSLNLIFVLKILCRIGIGPTYLRRNETFLIISLLLYKSTIKLNYWIIFKSTNYHLSVHSFMSFHWQTTKKYYIYTEKTICLSNWLHFRFRFSGIVNPCAMLGKHKKSKSFLSIFMILVRLFVNFLCQNCSECCNLHYLICIFPW